MLGVIRKQLGLNFLGETHQHIRFIIADLYIEGIENKVSVIRHKFSSWVLMGIISIGILGETHPTQRECCEFCL